MKDKIVDLIAALCIVGMCVGIAAVMAFGV